MSLISALCLLLFLGGDQSLMALKRHALSNEIRMTALITGARSGVYRIDDKVIRAMAQVPRHLYIVHPFERLAYQNVALPAVGHGYVIPEPFITAMMVHLLKLSRNDKVLDIGFGGGYDTAVMARLAREVHTVIEPSPSGKTENYARGVPRNLHIHKGGGQFGWPAGAPYNAILVRQSMREPPLALLRQLKPGGRLVIPVGAPGEVQRLTVYTRTATGRIAARPTLYVRIAPLFEGEEI